MLHGIEGLLNEQYIDLSEHIETDLDVELLKRTRPPISAPAAINCRMIHENIESYEKIFEILDKLNIECFIYIGGNDSMDTIKKLSDYAIIKGYPTKFVGVPKTIDNDLALTDHTPGYGAPPNISAHPPRKSSRTAALSFTAKVLLPLLRLWDVMRVG